MEKFNGFSQDEIKKVEKKIGMFGNKPPKVQGILQVQVGKGTSDQQPHTGILRIENKPMSENVIRNIVNNKNHLFATPIPQSARIQAKIRKTISASSTGTLNSAKPAPTPIITATVPLNQNNISDGSAVENTLDEISVDRSMSKSIEEALFYQPLKLLNANGEQNKATTIETTETSIPSTEEAISNVDNSASEQQAQLSILASVESPFKGVSLKEFETHRKLIEEQNRERKHLLCKAIELHSQKTAAETRKIEEIKIELSKLDNELSMDVAILRKQIDAASINYSTLEKQYMKIEAQFLKAKMDLHQAAEKKELLTEHLCTVIAHNEDRKSTKLSELMLKVGLTPSGHLQTIDNSSATQL